MKGWPKLIASAAGPTHDLNSNDILPSFSRESDVISHPLQSTPACPDCGYDEITSLMDDEASFVDNVAGANHVERIQLCALALHCSIAQDFEGIAAVVSGARSASFLKTSRREWNCWQALVVRCYEIQAHKHL